MNLGFGTFNKPDPGEGTQISKGFITGGIVDGNNPDSAAVGIFAERTQAQFRQFRGFIIGQQNCKHGVLPLLSFSLHGYYSGWKMHLQIISDCPETCTGKSENEGFGCGNGKAAQALPDGPQTVRRE